MSLIVLGMIFFRVEFTFSKIKGFRAFQTCHRISNIAYVTYQRVAK